MKNIHVLPTDKPSRIHVDLRSTFLTPNHQIGKEINSVVDSINIYITNDEPAYPYALHLKNQEVLKINGVGENSGELYHDKGFSYPDQCKKIILTTDQDLIKDGVQAIDDEFLEWFVKNPNCESVEIRKIEDELISPKNPKIRFNALQDPPSFISAESLNNMILTYKYEIIIPKETFKQKTKDRIMSETSEETKQKARDYGNSLIKQDRTCTHNCSAVCGECQILEPKPLLSVEWLLRYIEDLNNKGYTFIPSSNKEIVKHIKQMEKDNMIAFLKFVFQQDGFDYEQAYNNFLKQQIL